MYPYDKIRCQKCLEADNIEIRRFVGAGGKRKVEVTCHVIVHAEPAVTVINDPDTPESSIGAGGNSLVHDLELYTKLIGVVYDFDGPAEHAAIEYEFAVRHPEEYAHLVEDKGHRMLGDDGYTMSTYLASLMGTLAREKSLVRGKTAATAPWDDGKATTWSHPARVDEDVTTWEDVAEREGIDVDQWPPTENLEVAEPVAA